MLDKTKAAMRGRQCDTENKEHLQLTRPCAGGQSLSDTGIPVSHAASILTVPANTGALNFPQWGELLGIEISAHPNVLHWRELAAAEISEIIDLHRWWKLPSKRVANLQLATVPEWVYANGAYPLRIFPVIPVMSPDLGRLILNRGRNSAYRNPDIWYRYGNPRNAQRQSTKKCFGQIPDMPYHSFGSIPRCCSSLRMMRLIHAASDSSPSCRCASSIKSRNSGSSLNWNGGLPRLSFLCVDTSITPDVMCLCVMTHYIHLKQIATPRTVRAVPRRLTKPLSEVTVMADNQSTQTRPKFTWRFLALNRHDKKAKPCRLSVEAATEREARSILAPHFILSLAARLPAAEVLS